MANPATILLVEDNQALLEGIAELLEVSATAYDVQVSRATDGRMGLEKVAEVHPDLIISDITMPRMGGFEFLEELRQRPEWIHIPVIFLTARGTHKDVLKGRLSGAEMYITKPYDNDELIQLVNSQLDRAFQLRDDRQRQLDSVSHNIIHLLNHEFRTPLTYVTAYNELLARGLQDEDAANLRQYLRGIQTGTERLNRLVSNLVQVMRLRTGQAAQDATKQATIVKGLPALLLAYTRLKQRDPEHQGISIHCQVPEKLPAIYADIQSLFVALDCIFDNAVKFTRLRKNQESEVIVTAAGNEEEVTISVIDNGIGLPAQVHKKVFDLFYQHNRAQFEQQGAGLGLAIVKGLVELNSGQVTIESDQRYGCTVKLSFPTYRKEIKVDDYASHHSWRKQPATILLVEDEWYLLDGLSELLSQFESDYELTVLKAFDGEEAMQVMNKTTPDLIISDIMMPRMDGYQLLTRIRANPAWISIPFIFLTAKGDHRDVVRGRSSGAEEYITKPYHANELFSLILTQLDRHFHRQYIVRQNFEELKQNVIDLLMADIELPLNMVSEYSDRMAINLETTRSEDELRVSLEAIQDGSRQVSQISKEFILLAELRTGGAVDWFSKREVITDINQMLTELANIWLVRKGPAEVLFKRDLHQSVPPILIDPELLRYALNRLVERILDNRSLRRPVPVLLSSRALGSSVQLSITVYGLERAEAEVEKIQELLESKESIVPELFEFDPSMLITKGIICYYQGTVHLEQESGRGSTIHLILPVNQNNGKNNKNGRLKEKI